MVWVVVHCSCISFTALRGFIVMISDINENVVRGWYYLLAYAFVIHFCLWKTIFTFLFLFWIFSSIFFSNAIQTLYTFVKCNNLYPAGNARRACFERRSSTRTKRSARISNRHPLYMASMHVCGATSANVRNVWCLCVCVYRQECGGVSWPVVWKEFSYYFYSYERKRKCVRARHVKVFFFCIFV